MVQELILNYLKTYLSKMIQLGESCLGSLGLLSILLLGPIGIMDWLLTSGM